MHEIDANGMVVSPNLAALGFIRDPMAERVYMHPAQMFSWMSCYKTVTIVNKGDGAPLPKPGFPSCMGRPITEDARLSKSEIQFRDRTGDQILVKIINLAVPELPEDLRGKAD
jgi:hypothetical protein